MTKLNSDIAFSSSVKKFQEKEGSRSMYENVMQSRDWKNSINEDLGAFIRERDSFYIASVNSDGQPYIQHRGGPPGFLKVLDDRTLGFADFSGNRQYITAGNVVEMRKVCLFLMSYPDRKRIKIWGEAHIVDSDDKLLKRLEDEAYGAHVERGLIIKVSAWDINCPQHITPRYTSEEIEPHIESLKERIKDLEMQLSAQEKS